MTLSVPVLLLDFDGVLNAITSKVPSRCWPSKTWRAEKFANHAGSWPIRWSSEPVKWLTELHEQGRVEVRWHTTWQDEANDVGKMLGLPEFKVQDCPEYHEAVRNGAALAACLAAAHMPMWWKYPAAERVLTEEHRSLIWIDDDINDHVPRAYRRVLAATHRVKMVCPMEASGLTPKNLKEIETTLVLWEECPRGALSGS